MVDEQVLSRDAAGDPPEAKVRAAAHAAPALDARHAGEQARRRAAQGFTTDDFRGELKRSKRSRAWKRLGIVAGCIVVLAAAAAIALFVTGSVNRVASSDMAPVLSPGDVVVVQKVSSVAAGDVIACADGNRILYKRVLAGPNSWVNIMGDGSLVVSDAQMPTSSSGSQSKSATTAKVSRQVPANTYFALADTQDASINGLANAVDFVTANQVQGKVAFRVWPVSSIGPVA